MRIKSRRGRTILSNILFTMIAVLFIQTTLFIVAIFIGGAFKNLDNSQFENFQKITSYRKSYIEKEIKNKWMNINSLYKEVTIIVEDTIKEEESSYDELIDGEVNISNQIINKLTEPLIKTINTNAVTGSFVIFGDLKIKDKYALYFSDTNTDKIIDSNNDIRIQIAPLAYENVYGALNSSYITRQYLYTTLTEQQRKSFYVPITTLLNNPTLNYENCGWWSTTYYLNDFNYPFISYTVPLVNDEGLIYGVFGIEISIEYLFELMPPIELDSNFNGLYFLSRRENGEMLEKFTVTSSNDSTLKVTSPVGLKILGITTKSYYKTEYDNIFEVKTTDTNYYLTFQSFKIYDNNTPFSDDDWVLVGVLPASVIHEFSSRLQIIIFITLLFSVILSTSIIVSLAYYITKPITNLTNQVKQTKFLEDLSLSKTSIKEIDELVSAIESLNDTIIESEVKLSKIIDLVNLPIVAFEYNYELNTVYTSKDVNEFLLFSDYKNESIEDYMNLFASLEKFRIKGEEIIYKYIDTKGYTRLIEVRYIQNSKKNTKTGIFIDVTEEYFEKENLLYERNIDSLTNIYNRRAFFDEIGEIFKDKDIIKKAAMIMLDIDDLKFINDTYGHDYGDEYIRVTAEIISYSIKDIKYKICGRRSGDEFFIFIYGFESVEEIEKEVKKLYNSFKNEISKAPDDSLHYIRASAGISIYPEDGEDYKDLIKFADYAMYEIKNSLKGEFKYFDQSSYEQNSYLLHNKEELNTLIENELVDFYFQAVIDIKDGSILGYEGLMRSLLPSFKGPIEILNVARSQFKLNKIERLTFLKILEKYTLHSSLFKNRKLFINSIANQKITEADVNLIEEKYGMYLSNIVMEFTEHEKAVKAITEQKCNLMKRWEGEIALDDYGTGFNSELSLLESNPNYVKIDISIVRNIHTDEDRQQMVRNIVDYTKNRGIKTIAEGVEYIEELETLIKIGCDYVQGYLLAKPDSLPQELSSEAVNLIKELNKKNHN